MEKKRKCKNNKNKNNRVTFEVPVTWNELSYIELPGNNALIIELQAL